MQLSKKTVQSPVSMTGQRRRLWVNIETVLVEWNVFAQSMQQTRLYSFQVVSRGSENQPLL